MDNLTLEQRRRNMQNIRSVNTNPELLVAKELRKRNIYFTRNVKTILGKPDFVFRRKKTAVFIDSDFWHGHPKRCVMPKSNLSYWEAKIERNRQRDNIVNKHLKSVGWKVIRVWEYDLKKNLEKSLKKILSAIDVS
jgi:DNA mismatch endonuclease (patch repair protein)